MSNGWYPILFLPIYKNFSWGGSLLEEHYSRKLPTSEMSVGESCELIDQGETQSIVENGDFKGKTLHDLTLSAPAEFVGLRHGLNQPFPLVIKYINAEKRLPLQVHPDHTISSRIQQAKPNNKMWYVIASRRRAKILVGIKRNCTQQQFLSRVGTSEIETVIQSFPSQTGDAYFISGGRVHAIDAGNLLLSIEQNSDTTYIISNWELGKSNSETVSSSTLELALRCIQFQDRTLARIRGESSLVNRNRKIPIIATCPFFTVDDIRLVQDLHDYTDGTTFHLLVPIDGKITVGSRNHSVEVEKGRICYIPAALGHYSIKPVNTSTKVLKITLRVD